MDFFIPRSNNLINKIFSILSFLGLKVGSKTVTYMNFVFNCLSVKEIYHYYFTCFICLNMYSWKLKKHATFEYR